MANVKFLTGSLAQYQALGTNVSADTLYFLDNGELYKGDVKYTGSKVQVVAAYPETMATDVLYINSTDKSMKFNNAEVEPAIVSTIGDTTAGTSLADVAAIKAYVEAELAKLPEAIDYSVELTDETAGETEYSKQTLTQASIEGDDKTVGTIVIPKVTMTADDSDSSIKKYVFKQGTTEIGTVNVPADMVVESGEVVKVTAEQAGTEGFPETAGTYIKLTIANEDEPLWINVADLVDVYTGKEETTGISVTVSDANVISAALVGKAVASGNIADGAVTADAIAEGAVTADALADDAVTTDAIADGNITEDKLSEDVKAKLGEIEWGTIA